MTDSEKPKAGAESNDPISFLTYRGRISRPYYFLYFDRSDPADRRDGVSCRGLNPTGSGAGPAIPIVILVVVAWFHSVAAVKRAKLTGFEVVIMTVLFSAVVLWVVLGVLPPKTKDGGT